MDWGIGQYELQALQLLPGVRQIVDDLAPAPGEFVVDLGCGSGSATFLIADRGVEVTGVDPASRLLDIARASATERSSNARFLSGDAANLPFPSQTVDAVVSTFALIFVPDPSAAAQEITRVLRPGGRLVFSAWIVEGAMAAQSAVVQRFLSSAPDPSRPAPFAWHDPAAVAGLFNPLGFSLSTQVRSLAFVGESPQAAAEAELAHHPRWAQVREQIQTDEQWAEVRAELVSLFVGANEDANAFRVTSRFVVHTAVLSSQSA